jgi:predicted permease
MLKNYVLVALRALRRQKGYAFINVLGLSVGLACSFFILLWVAHEVRYDRFHEGGDRLYRAMRHAHLGDNIYTWSAMPKPLAGVLEEDIPEVEHAALLSWRERSILTAGDRSFREEGYFAGPAFFEMFSFPFLTGDPATAIDDPTSIAISASAAERIFGPDWRADGVVGRTLTVDHRKDFRVAGVFADVPEASSLRFDFVLPIEDFLARNDWTEHWGNSGLEIYVELNEGASLAEADAKVAPLITEHHEGAHATVFLQPFEDMRLWGNYRDGELAGGRIEFVRVFVVVAVFLLLIAAINFMNLATARAGQRAKEIGVRKAIGAGKGALARQFLVESALLALVAFVLALALVAALLPAFGDLTGIDLALGAIDPRFLLAGLGIALVTGLLAGSYPALYLSSFSPTAVLRGTFRQGPGAARLRKGLVVFQFALSTLLIVGTLTVYLQMDYIRTKNLGVDRENVVSMALEGPAREQYDAFRQELLARPGIQTVTASSQSPLNVGSSTTDPAWEGKPEDDNTLFHIIDTNYDFVEAMRMELAAGRTFSRDFASDTANYVVNERAVEAMGLETPIGEPLSFWGQDGQIIGVVEDFHMNSLYSEIEPTILRLDPPDAGRLFVRTAPGQTPEALASLEAVHARFNPGYPFDYEFLDADYEEMYRGELVMGALSRIFAGIAIFVACLGLFGLAAFMAEQRRKEVGVRKVLGASVPSLVALLSKDFAWLVVAAFAVAAPVSYFLMSRWLDGFAYRIDLGPVVFVAAGLVALAVALLTVSYHAFRTATADPVKALRYE